MKMQEFEINRLKQEVAERDNLVWMQEREIETQKKTNKLLTVIMWILIVINATVFLMLAMYS